jgi:hypothetical protein
MANKNILLIEPGYKNKYPPLGLMKIASYHGPYGKKDNVTFIKGLENTNVFKVNWDRIYVTSLFSFEWNEISKTIDYALSIVNGDASRVFVGGIAASLMHGSFLEVTKWRGVRFIKGLLGESPPDSLQLDEFDEDLYADDHNHPPIEDLVPDYSILDQIADDYVYPVNDAYFAYASRGCVRKCHFCGVPKLEGAQRDAKSITALVNSIIERYGEKKDLMLMDNNVVASENYQNIIAEIRDLGFERGAKLSRGGSKLQRRVDFNQGVDARILCKDIMYLKEMSTIAIKPLRIAFDHIGARKPYETAIRMSHEVGIHELSNYMLYNFTDSPSDLYQRMRLNIDLNEELQIRIFSFPMRYQPTDMKNRSFIGEKWTKFDLRSVQTILQATHGVVSGSPEFFKNAFGENEEKFHDLLLRPEHYLFNRAWYEKYEGRAEFEEFLGKYKKLNDENKKELAELLSTVPNSKVSGIIGKASNSKVNSILPYYVRLEKDEELYIWKKAKEYRIEETNEVIPEDELVEDAGLQERV